MSHADPGILATHTDPRRPPEAEMKINLGGDFELALAGDCIPSRPIAQLQARLPGFAAVVDLLQSADLSCGNLETSIIDLCRFSGHPYCCNGDWPLLADPSVAGDLSALGFRMFARANNHALDWGIEGMRETADRLDAAGLAHAGAANGLGLARQPAICETRKGRIGLVSVATTFRPTSEAMAAHHAIPGRPGISGLRLRQIDILPQPDIDLLAGLATKRQPDGRLELFERTFEAGAERGYRHEMDEGDLTDILRNIRNGKQHSDLLVVMLHAHEAGRDGYPEPPSPFLKQFAHAAIDAGADAVSVSGIHHLGPVDLYRGRPIFYGLGNFIWSDMQEALPSELFALNRDLLQSACENPERATAADFNAIVNADYFAKPEVFETILPILRFEAGALVEVILHPIDLGYGNPLTLSGIPRLATRDHGDQILTRIRDISLAYGCKHPMEIVDGLGYLRP